MAHGKERQVRRSIEYLHIQAVGVHAPVTYQIQPIVTVLGVNIVKDITFGTVTGYGRIYIAFIIVQEPAILIRVCRGRTNRCIIHRSGAPAHVESGEVFHLDLRYSAVTDQQIHNFGGKRYPLNTLCRKGNAGVTVYVTGHLDAMAYRRYGRIGEGIEQCRCLCHGTGHVHIHILRFHTSGSKVGDYKIAGIVTGKTVGNGTSQVDLALLGAGKGIQVLRQDPWETLITFILSQRKRIPAIANNVETIARLGGHLIETDRESLFSFPTPREFMRIEMGMLKAAGVGYRLPYICDARDKVISGEIDLIAMEELSDEGLFDTLKTIYGVGNKIANCVCLYAYGRIARVPIDTWIRKVINNTCEGRNPFPGFGDVAGVIQQYVFYTEQMRKRGMWMIEIEDSASCRASAEADAGDIEEPVG